MSNWLLRYCDLFVVSSALEKYNLLIDIMEFLNKVTSCYADVFVIISRHFRNRRIFISKIEPCMTELIEARLILMVSVVGIFIVLLMTRKPA